MTNIDEINLELQCVSDQLKEDEAEAIATDSLTQDNITGDSHGTT